MIFIMVRGLFWNFDYPLAHFLFSKTTSEEMFTLIWRCVEVLEMAGLKVVMVILALAQDCREDEKIVEQDEFTLIKQPCA